jgi:endoglucanase
VVLGEFGGRSVGRDQEGVWQRKLVEYLKQNKISYTYWSWNPNSGDTGGVLADDWTTVNKDKMALLKSYQAPMAAKPSASNPA